MGIAPRILKIGGDKQPKSVVTYEVTTVNRLFCVCKCHVSHPRMVRVA